MGQFAFKLMKTGAFQNARGIKLFDNSMPVGKKVMGITILPGSDILKEFKKEKFSLVITSLIHEVSIKKGISDIFIANNEEPPIMVGFSHLLTN
jgi:hypothetical protein